MKLSDFTKLMHKELSAILPENELKNHAAILYEYFLGYSRAQVVLNEGEEIPSNKLLSLLSVLAELKKYKPIDYILNQSVFFGREFYVNEHVLIPRSETEELVQWILEDEISDGKLVLDIGSGSGCIPITLFLEGNFAEVNALEVSPEANKVAEQNAVNLSAKVQFETKDILKELPNKQYDIVVSNPPYVKEEELSSLDKNVIEYEPKIALAPLGSNDPLLFYKRMISIAPEMLKKGGVMYWEIHEDLGKEVLELFVDTKFKKVELRDDIYGRDRLVKAQWT